MRNVGWICGFMVAACGVAVGQGAAAGCAALASLKLDSAKVTSAVLVNAGALKDVAKLPAAKLAGMPEFCQVQVLDTPSADSQVKLQVWLPVTWNGRYRGTGNGGFAGEISFGEMASALAQGYATSGTDTGHSEQGADWALGHPEKVKDFGWRGIHDTAVETKALVQAFYGKAPAKSYFTACSDGGREALMEAQRFPADYDGILAGAPAYNWTALVSSGSEDEQALSARAAGYIPAAKIPAIGAAVRAACHAEDGVVEDPRSCRFQPKTLACKGADTDSCLMPEQVKTLETIYRAKVDGTGRTVYPGYLPGAEDAPESWVQWVVGHQQNGDALMLFFSQGYFRNFVKQQPDWSLGSFDFARDYKEATEKTGAALNATDPNLKAFSARGGKLVMYHGWNDPAIPALGTVRYYDDVVGALGQTATDASVSLYMVPGMLHCGGGPGVTEFGEGNESARGDAQHDVLTGLVEWVEAGKAPGTLTASGHGMTRPVCVYPQVARYRGGDRKQAVSWSCLASAK